jgi:hypothetical protein
MKPVIVQNLIRSMRRRVKLPMPRPADEIPTRKDRSGQFVLIFALLVLLAVFFM